MECVTTIPIESATESAGVLGLPRRFLFWLAASLMAEMELLFLLSLVGFDHAPGPGIVAIALVLPFGATAGALYRERRAPPLEPVEWKRWLAIGAAVTALWALSYFASGALTDPARVRMLSHALDDHFPFDTRFSYLYTLLYPIFVLPFFVVKSRGAFRRLVLADLGMVIVCTTIFLAVPIAFPRPEALPVGQGLLSTWLMGLLQAGDKPWNCLPSEHCAAALIATCFCWEASRKVGLFALGATLAIGVSTLFTKQHYLADVVAGYALALILYWGTRRFGGSRARA